MIKKKELLKRIELLEKEIVNINSLFRKTGLVCDVGWMGLSIHLDLSDMDRKVGGLLDYHNLKIEKREERYVIVKRKRERKL